MKKILLTCLITFLSFTSQSNEITKNYCDDSLDLAYFISDLYSFFHNETIDPLVTQINPVHFHSGFDNNIWFSNIYPALEKCGMTKEDVENFQETYLKKERIFLLKEKNETFEVRAYPRAIDIANELLRRVNQK